MKAVLISIQPKWCELIASGEKTVEIRKTKPKLETPFKVYIYCTQDKRLLHKFDKGERIDDEHFFKEHVFVRQNTWIRGHFNPNGKVIGEFVCNKIEDIQIRHFTVFGHENLYTAVGENPDNQWLKHSCLSYSEVVQYGKLAPLYGWHISDLVIYDKPKRLSEFKRPCNGNCQECEYALWQTYTFISESKIVGCAQKVKAPQSWCYVEEVGR